MRVVVDTNVFVSAALKDRSAPALAVHLVARRGTLLKSAATERQLFEVLERPRLAPLIASAAREWLARLLATAELVTITERIVACRDPTDDKFLELAVNGGADFIVSGDADLLVLNPFRGIPIITPDRYRHAVAT
jgi:putative PIN family toxin of toxin-antitoxin system